MRENVSPFVMGFLNRHGASNRDMLKVLALLKAMAIKGVSFPGVPGVP